MVTEPVSEEKVGFVICSVRKASEQLKKEIAQRVTELESDGWTIHWPTRDTEQEDPTGGFRICQDNGINMMLGGTIFVFWDPGSNGSYFDLGMLFMLGLLEHPKKIVIESVPSLRKVEDIVAEERKKGITKSHSQLLLEMVKRAA